MLRHPKKWGLFVCIVGLTFALALFFVHNARKEASLQRLKTELIEENAYLKNENDRLDNTIATLTRQNLSLKKYLDVYENHFTALNDAAGTWYRLKSMLPAELPDGLTKERFEIRQAFLKLLGEKKRWDLYQQGGYRDVLETRSEPDLIAARNLELEDEENAVYFKELETALQLHRRLIRDVRLFHDEVQYQSQQQQAGGGYELYDLKFKLAPFARESALVDALQQAMSALSAGIYQQEAVAVLERIGDVFTQPIQQLFEQRKDSGGAPVAIQFNYNLYTLYGKKLLDYADTLTRQSAITLGPSAFGELDYFNRWLADNLYVLYQIGRDEAIDPSRLNLDELAQILQSRP